MSGTRLSIVIPAFNEEKELPACLASIHRAVDELQCRNSVEIIVCDNNSTDATAELATKSGAKVVFEPVNQIARARNAGAGVAVGEWLLFIDADSRLDVVNLSRVLQCTNTEKRTAGGGCTIGMIDVPLVGFLLIAIWNITSKLAGWAAGSFVFCRRNAFSEVGGFSLSLYAAEEIEFSKKLKVWAKRNSLRWVVLSGHPHMSSSRKLRLYKPMEVMRWTLRGMLRGRRALSDRKNLDFFYDGRR